MVTLFHLIIRKHFKTIWFVLYNVKHLYVNGTLVVNHFELIINYYVPFVRLSNIVYTILLTINPPPKDISPSPIDSCVIPLDNCLP